MITQTLLPSLAYLVVGEPRLEKALTEHYLPTPVLTIKACSPPYGEEGTSLHQWALASLTTLVFCKSYQSSEIGIKTPPRALWYFGVGWTGKGSWRIISLPRLQSLAAEGLTELSCVGSRGVGLSCSTPCLAQVWVWGKAWFG